MLSGCSAKLDKEKYTKDMQSALKNELIEDFKEPISDYKSINGNLASVLNDKELENLINIAVVNNRDMLILASRIEQAKAQAKIAGANLLPTVTGNLTGGGSGNNSNSQNYTSGGSVFSSSNYLSAATRISWEIDIFGRLNNLRKSSIEQLEYAKANSENFKITLQSDLATYLYTIKNLELSIKIIETKIKNIEEMLTITRNRYNLGVVDFASVSSMEMQLNNEISSYQNTKYTLEQNINSIKTLLSISDIEDTILSKDNEYIFPSVSLGNVSQIPVDIILNRADIKSSIHSLNAQMHKAASAKSALFPTLSLSGSITQTLSASNGITNLVWQIVGSLSAPIINRTSLTQEHILQNELSKEYFYLLEKNIATALGEIENSIFQLNAQNRILENTVRYFGISKDNFIIIKSRNENGLSDRVEYLTAQNSFLTTEMEKNSATLSKLIAVISIFRSFGGNLYIQTSDGEKQ